MTGLSAHHFWAEVYDSTCMYAFAADWLASVEHARAHHVSSKLVSVAQDSVCWPLTKAQLSCLILICQMMQVIMHISVLSNALMRMGRICVVYSGNCHCCTMTCRVIAVGKALLDHFVESISEGFELFICSTVGNMLLHQRHVMGVKRREACNTRF